MKKIVLMIAVFMMFSIGLSFAETTSEEPVITVYVHGKAVVWSDAKPFIDSNGRTMIPLRAVSENLGADVSWDQENMTAKVNLNDIAVELPVNKTFGMVNGVQVNMDTMTILSGGRTYVPLRFVSENLGYEIGYFQTNDGIDLDKISHVITIGIKRTNVIKPRTEIGWDDGAVLSLEEKEIYQQMFKTVIPNRLMAMGGAYYLLYEDADISMIDAIKIKHEKSYYGEEYIEIAIIYMPEGWDEFILNTFIVLMGEQDGRAIAEELIRDFKSVYDKEENNYMLHELGAKKVKSGIYTHDYSIGKITWPQ